MQVFKKFARTLLRLPVRSQVQARQLPYIWDGIFCHYRDAPVSGPGFGGDEWISSTERATTRGLQLLLGDRLTVPRDVPEYHSLVAAVTGILSSKHGLPRILDFGGAMGLTYVDIVRCLGDVPDLDYTVFDNERSCRYGADLFRDQSNVKFSSTLPPPDCQFDLILLSGVLQFVDDYHSLLRALTDYSPSYWLFTFLPAGDIPTFASTQRNVPGSTIPVWFFNLNELVQEMRELGFKLIFKSAMSRQFDMGNFPDSHRLSQQCNLFFQRIGN